MLRDREAQNFHAQSQELAEAERLEQEAREHRERAVAQGLLFLMVIAWLNVLSCCLQAPTPAMPLRSWLSRCLA